MILPRESVIIPLKYIACGGLPLIVCLAFNARSATLWPLIKCVVEKFALLKLVAWARGDRARRCLAMLWALGVLGNSSWFHHFANERGVVLGAPILLPGRFVMLYLTGLRQSWTRPSWTDPDYNLTLLSCGIFLGRPILVCSWGTPFLSRPTPIDVTWVAGRFGWHVSWKPWVLVQRSWTADGRPI